MRILLAALLLVVASAGAAGPYEAADWSAPATPLDELVGAALADHGIEAAGPCSDCVFLRRAFLDVIGTLPTPYEVRAFANDTRPDKRARLIDDLLARDEFAQYWSMKWCDLLRVKAEFPINLWPNAVQAYHQWIYDAVRSNMPYDQFVRALLTSSGSNFRVPPVNFYRAIQGRQPAEIASAVALTFMGTRLASWPESDREAMALFFSRIAYKPTDEWKEEIVCLKPDAEGPLEARFPDGEGVTIPAGQDPRVVFADWLTSRENPWLARNAVNRVWSWLLGRGIIREADDVRPDNPPSNPELLAYLEKEFVAADYDLKHVYRLILNSRTYQQSSIPRAASPDAEALFAVYPVRRVDAEVLADALAWLTGATADYLSPIPEPFTYIPGSQRAIRLADGSISTPFLEMFGRPPRDTGLESERNNTMTDAQRLYFINSRDIQQSIAKSGGLQNLLDIASRDQREAISAAYITILSREPTEEEIAAIGHYAQTSKQTPKDIAQDLVWALINSKEFLYRH